MTSDKFEKGSYKENSNYKTLEMHNNWGTEITPKNAKITDGEEVVHVKLKGMEHICKNSSVQTILQRVWLWSTKGVVRSRS